jgi:prepilin-type N-terminal cleavage/methylation domain-containing protein
MKNMKSQQGFTLIEILVVIGLIAILAAVVLIAINPARQFAQGRDSQRISNINAILNAVSQRIADNKGTFAGTFVVGSTTYTCGPILTATGSITTLMAGDTTTNTGALGCLVPTYIPSLPTDPTGASGTDTGYKIYQEAGTGRVHLIADQTEPSITRTDPLTVVR